MRTTSTFSVLFWIYTQRADKNNCSIIYARITLNGKNVNISLKQKVNLDSWEPKRQKLKGNGKTSRAVNYYLDEVKATIVQSYRDLVNESKAVTPQLIKARYLGEDTRNHTLKNIFSYHNDKLGVNLAPKTLCHYRTSQKYLLKFLEVEYRKADIFLCDLDYSFVLGFESFLRSYKPEHYQGQIANNAVMKHIQRLRRMITLAYHMEWLERDPFIKFKPKLEKREREFLTEMELSKIEEYSPTNDRMAIVKDLFIFSCYTGICYGDMMDLTKNNIVTDDDKNLWIIANRNKTGTSFKVPILAKAEELIQKYKEHPRTLFNCKLLPTISNQKLNSYLKEMADFCDLKKNLTFHMARHTFATIVTLTNGVPIETVSKLLGHTKLATTQIYAKVIEKKIIEDMNALKHKLDNK